MENKRYTVELVSLGCDKNRVDSEIMLDIMKNRYKIVADPADAEILIVNTCGFIEDAKQESINTILEMARFKETGRCRLLMATGCLTQRYGQELLDAMPELDVIMGVNSYGNLKENIDRFMETEEKIVDIVYSDKGINEGERVLSDTMGTSAYLRISEGCSKNCTYCIIPKIRGAYRSREESYILKEAERLAKSGIKELIIIAQDTTMYGTDLYGRQTLHELLKKLNDIEGLRWIRLMYMYPEGIYDELLEVISQSSKILHYFDMPIQHSSDRILKRMGRRTDRKKITDLMEKIRQYMPDAVLRTSLIVGFPGETDEDIEDLKSFIEEVRFEKLGVFAYSREEGTPAYSLPDQIDEELKQERRDIIMTRQQEISKDINLSKKGKEYEVLIEEFDGENYIGRNWEMAPEIDGNVIVKSDENLILGDFKNVRITASAEYDLYGEAIKNESAK